MDATISLSYMYYGIEAPPHPPPTPLKKKGFTWYHCYHSLVDPLLFLWAFQYITNALSVLTTATIDPLLPLCRLKIPPQNQ